MRLSGSRVLHVFGSLDRGGAETAIMNVYRKINRDSIQFDFIVNGSDRKYDYEEEIQQLGGRVYRLPKLRLRDYKRYRHAWASILNEHPEWKIIHIHHTSVAAFTIGLAKKSGCTTIVHSHTAGSDGSLKARLKIITRYPVRYLADYLFACSANSAHWMFGGKSKDAVILHNAIDVQSFLPDKSIRKHVRNAMGFDSEHKVVGHVGRFVDVKNHVFLLDVLVAMKKMHENIFFVLIGGGPLKESIQNKAKLLGVSDKIIFAGVRSDISELMQAMDAFIFPSLYEGLPVTLVEAQASGLPCLVSDAVNEDVKLTDCVKFMSLNASPTIWAERLLEMCAGSAARANVYGDLSAAGYDVRGNASWLEKFYNQIIENA